MPEARLPRGEIVAVGPHRIHYLDYGSGPAIAFSHGSGPGANGYSDFKQNINAVVASSYRATVFDMLGFGYSSKPIDLDHTTDLFPDTTRGALAAIGVDRCVIIGKSLGGAVDIRIALDASDLVAGLVLMPPDDIESNVIYYTMPGMQAMISSFTNGTLDFEGLRGLLHQLVADPALVDDALGAERYEALKTQPVKGRSRLPVVDMSGELSALACPILGVWGQQDLFTPTPGYVRFIPASADCSFTIVANCRHGVMVERQPMLNDQLAAFLSRLPRSVEARQWAHATPAYSGKLP